MPTSPPPNTTPATATVLTTLPFAASLDVTAAPQAFTNIPANSGGLSYRAVWYQWTCPAGVDLLMVGGWEAAGAGPDYAPSCSVWVGTASALSLLSVDQLGDTTVVQRWLTAETYLRVPAVAGTTYWIQLSNTDPATAALLTVKALALPTAPAPPLGSIGIPDATPTYPLAVLAPSGTFLQFRHFPASFHLTSLPDGSLCASDSLDGQYYQTAIVIFSAALVQVARRDFAPAYVVGIWDDRHDHYYVATSTHDAPYTNTLYKLAKADAAIVRTTPLHASSSARPGVGAVTQDGTTFFVGNYGTTESTTRQYIEQWNLTTGALVQTWEVTAALTGHGGWLSFGLGFSLATGAYFFPTSGTPTSTGAAVLQFNPADATIVRVYPLYPAVLSGGTLIPDGCCYYSETQLVLKGQQFDGTHTALEIVDIATGATVVASSLFPTTNNSVYGPLPNQAPTAYKRAPLVVLRLTDPVEPELPECVSGAFPIDPSVEPPPVEPPLIPAGTIMIGGWGDSGVWKFLSPDGATTYAPPPAMPTNFSSLSVCCRTSAGHVALAGAYADPYFGDTNAGLLKASDLSVLSENAVQHAIPGFCLAVDALGHWYTLRLNLDNDAAISGSIAQFNRLNAASTAVATWDIPLPLAYQDSQLWAMAVSADGQTAYVWLQPFPFNFDENSKHYGIYTFSFVGTGAFVGPFTSDYNYNAPHGGGLHAVPDGSGDLLVCFNNLNGTTPTGTTVIRRYRADGTVVWTAGTPAGADPLGYGYLALGVPGDTHFLCYGYDGNADTSSGARYCWFSYATGAPDNSRNFCPDDGAGFEFDSQFVVLAVPILDPTAPPEAPPPCITGGFPIDNIDGPPIEPPPPRYVGVTVTNHGLVGSHGYNAIAFDLQTGAVVATCDFPFAPSSILYRPETEDFLVTSRGPSPADLLHHLDRSLTLLSTIELPPAPDGTYTPGQATWSPSLIRSDYHGGVYIVYQPAAGGTPVVFGDQLLRKIDPVTGATLQSWRTFVTPIDQRSIVAADFSLDGQAFFFSMTGGPDLHQNRVYRLPLASTAATVFATYGTWSGDSNPTGNTFSTAFLRPRPGGTYAALTFHMNAGQIDGNELLLIAADGTVGTAYPTVPSPSSFRVRAVALALSPDGQTAWFTTTNSMIVQMDLTTGVWTYVVDGPASDFFGGFGDLAVVQGWPGRRA